MSFISKIKLLYEPKRVRIVSIKANNTVVLGKVYSIYFCVIEGEGIRRVNFLDTVISFALENEFGVKIGMPELCCGVSRYDQVQACINYTTTTNAPLVDLHISIINTVSCPADIQYANKRPDTGKMLALYYTR